MINYNDKKFRAISNTENGETSSDTIFHYQQNNNILSSKYSGGEIQLGHLIGIVHNNGTIDMNYHHINFQNEIKSGVCHSTPEILLNGKIRLHEVWQWTSGDQTKGVSILEEI